jgi:hypothetical protein
MVDNPNTHPMDKILTRTTTGTSPCVTELSVRIDDDSCINPITPSANEINMDVTMTMCKCVKEQDILQLTHKIVELQDLIDNSALEFLEQHHNNPQLCSQFTSLRDANSELSSRLAVINEELSKALYSSPSRLGGGGGVPITADLTADMSPSSMHMTSDAASHQVFKDSLASSSSSVIVNDYDSNSLLSPNNSSIHNCGSVHSRTTNNFCSLMMDNPSRISTFVCDVERWHSGETATFCKDCDQQDDCHSKYNTSVATTRSSTAFPTHKRCVYKISESAVTDSPSSDED